MKKVLLYLLVGLSVSTVAVAQQSVARLWNEALLQSIREDFACPTVHARNLFHTSVAMWDAWAAYDTSSEPYMLGNSINGFECGYGGIPAPANIESAREKALSYATYRLLTHRFTFSPGVQNALARYNVLMNDLGYDVSLISTDYAGGDPAFLGNYIAECIINYGLQDGANEAELYTNRFYRPINPPIAPALDGNPNISDLNRWQPISLDVFIDQAGQQIPLGTPEFLGPEWGSVEPFSLSWDDLDIFERDGNEFWVYFDPGAPPYLDIQDGGGLLDEYKWNFALVSVWSSHLDPSDGVMIDISPAAIGNVDIDTMPRDLESFDTFYDTIGGGDPGLGRRLNPFTGSPYDAQIIPRGDYGRVLAEFWADGPDSETPPGHWFTLLNYVNDHPVFEKRFRGEGPILDDLEWDVKSYLILGGGMHDVAIAAWGIKGWYDYIRPVSTLRGMAEFGQSSDPNFPRYHIAGLPLMPGYIEMVEEGDALAGTNNQHVDKIKLRSWRGPGFVFDPATDTGGVDWILAANWWPYQRPSFVTPPFAGYISGHSTFSRAAAEILTLLTGDEYFPGGMGEFVAPKNEFLVFEDGPSEDVILQWATYRDASDQCSLSRIWGGGGGIHPSADDLFGRFIGEQIGPAAFSFAERFFTGQATALEDESLPKREGFTVMYPNPIQAGRFVSIETYGSGVLSVLDVQGREVKQVELSEGFNSISTDGFSAGVYFLRFVQEGTVSSRSLVVVR